MGVSSARGAVQAQLALSTAPSQNWRARMGNVLFMHKDGTRVHAGWRLHDGVGEQVSQGLFLLNAPFKE
jgi:hypothetical protein